MENNKALVTQFYAEAITARNPSAVDRFLSEDFVHNGELRGRSGEREALKAFLAGFSDLSVETITQIAEDNVVAGLRRWTGTHDGEFAGQAPTGRRVEFTSTTILHFSEGKITEVWDEVDVLGLMTQIGLISELETKDPSSHNA